MNKYSLSKDHKYFIIGHQDSSFGCEHEIKVETLLRVLKPVLKENGEELLDIVVAQALEGKHQYVQLLNPVTKTYVLVDKTMGRIVSHHPRKNTPYKNVEIVRKKDGK